MTEANSKISEKEEELLKNYTNLSYEIDWKIEEFNLAALHLFVAKISRIIPEAETINFKMVFSDEIKPTTGKQILVAAGVYNKDNEMLDGSKLKNLTVQVYSSFFQDVYPAVENYTDTPPYLGTVRVSSISF